VLADGVPGDVLEAGVWRGGATIFARGVLEAHGVRDRRVWVADSFAGLPPSVQLSRPEFPGAVFDIHGPSLGIVLPGATDRNFLNRPCISA